MDNTKWKCLDKTICNGKHTTLESFETPEGILYKSTAVYYVLVRGGSEVACASESMQFVPRVIVEGLGPEPMSKNARKIRYPNDELPLRVGGPAGD